MLTSFDDIAQVLTIMAANYQRQTETGTADLWYEKFKNIDREIFLDASTKVIDRCKRFPTIADMREVIDDVQRRRNLEQDNHKTILGTDSQTSKKIAGQTFHFLQTLCKAEPDQRPRMIKNFKQHMKSVVSNEKKHYQDLPN